MTSSIHGQTRQYVDLPRVFQEQRLSEAEPEDYQWRCGVLGWKATRVKASGDINRISLMERGDPKRIGHDGGFFVILPFYLFGLLTIIIGNAIQGIDEWATIVLSIVYILLMFVALNKVKIFPDNIYTIYYNRHTRPVFFGKKRKKVEEQVNVLNSKRVNSKNSPHTYEAALIAHGASVTNARLLSTLPQTKALKGGDTALRQGRNGNAVKKNTAKPVNLAPVKIDKGLDTAISMDSRLKLLPHLESVQEMMQPVTVQHLQQYKEHVIRCSDNLVAMRKSKVLSPEQLSSLEQEFTLLVDDIMPMLQRMQSELTESSMDTMKAARTFVTSHNVDGGSLSLQK